MNLIYRTYLYILEPPANRASPRLAKPAPRPTPFKLQGKVILHRGGDAGCAAADFLAIEIAEEGVAQGEHGAGCGLPVAYEDQTRAMIGKGGEGSAVAQLRFVAVDARGVIVGPEAGQKRVQLERGQGVPHTARREHPAPAHRGRLRN